MLVFVGSYAEKNEDGVELFNFDETEGTLTRLAAYQGLQNPTFLNVNADNKSIYAICEVKNEDGSKSGAIAHFKYSDHELVFVNSIRSVAGTTCHIQRDLNNRYLIVTSYHGGMVGLIGLNEDGTLGEVYDIAQHIGTSVDPERQDRPHPHSSFFSPNGKFLYVQDLGLDKLIYYTIDYEKHSFVKQGEFDLPGGSGPRHLTFHPTLDIAYVINELNSTVSVLKYKVETGELSTVQHISTLPVSYSGDNGTAEITISNDGKFVYGSNRGHDSIVVYAVQANGELELIEHIPSGGGHPRHFTLTPSNQHVLVANRDHNNIVIFSRDQQSGQLTSTGSQAFSTKPVCVIPVS